MTSLMEDADDRFAGIDIDSLLNGQRRPLSFERKKALYEAPEFIQRLNGEETVMEGQSLCIECKIRGFPVPYLRWFKDDEEILDHPRIHVESDGIGGYYLILDHVTREDEAAYRCRAENVEGACSSFFFLSVKGKPKRRETIPSWRTVSFPPMFSTIVEKVEEEEKLGRELEDLPPSPMTEFYYALTLKSRCSWPTFLGDWAFANNIHPYKRHSNISDDDDEADTEEEEEGDDESFDSFFIPNGDICDKLKYHNSSKAHFAAKRSSRKKAATGQAKVKKQKLGNKTDKEAERGINNIGSGHVFGNKNEKNKSKTENALEIKGIEKNMMFEITEIGNRPQGHSATKEEIMGTTKSKDEITMPSLTFYKDTNDPEILPLTDNNNHKEKKMGTEETADNRNKSHDWIENDKNVSLTKRKEEDTEHFYYTKEKALTTLQKGHETDNKEIDNKTTTPLVSGKLEEDREMNRGKISQKISSKPDEQCLWKTAGNDVYNNNEYLGPDIKDSVGTAPVPKPLRVLKLDTPENSSLMHENEIHQTLNAESERKEKSLSLNAESERKEKSLSLNAESERKEKSQSLNVEFERKERSPSRRNETNAERQMVLEEPRRNMDKNMDMVTNNRWSTDTKNMDMVTNNRWSTDTTNMDMVTNNRWSTDTTNMDMVTNNRWSTDTKNTIGSSTHGRKHSTEGEYKTYQLRQSINKGTKVQQTQTSGKDRLEELRQQEAKRMEELKQEELKRMEELRQEGKTNTYAYKRTRIKYEDVRERERKQIEELRQKEQLLRDELQQKEQKQLEDLRKKEGSLIEQMKSKEHTFSDTSTRYEQDQREESLTRQREELRLREQNQMEEFKEKESIHKDEFILKESMEIEDLKAYERKLLGNVKMKDGTYYDQFNQQTEYELQKDENELDARKKIKEREILLYEKKEKMRKEQLRRQYEEELQKRRKKEEEAKRERILRQDVAKDNKIMSKLHKRSVSLREENFAASGRMFTDVSYSNTDTKPRLSFRMKNMEDTDLSTTKFQDSTSCARNSFTNSLDRSSRKSSKYLTQTTNDDLYNQPRSISEKHSYLTEITNKENDNRYTHRTFGNRNTEGISHSLDTDLSSSFCNKYSKPLSQSKVQKPLSFASFFAIEDSRVAKPSLRSHDDLVKLAESIAAKRERFHEYISHCSTEDNVSTVPTQKEKMTSSQDRQAEGDHTVHVRQQASDMSSEPEKTVNARYLNGTDRSADTSNPVPKNQAELSSSALSSVPRNGAACEPSVLEIRPFLYNSARTTARRFHKKE